MGGSSGGGLSSIDLSRLTEIAEARLKQLAQSGTRILFVCEKEDRKSLDSHLLRSKVFAKEKSIVCDATQEKAALAEVDNSSIIAAYTDDARSAQFLDQIIETSLAKKKQGIHVKAKANSLIPSKAMAYRWPSLEWDAFEVMFKE